MDNSSTQDFKQTEAYIEMFVHQYEVRDFRNHSFPVGKWNSEIHDFDRRILSYQKDSGHDCCICGQRVHLELVEAVDEGDLKGIMRADSDCMYPNGLEYTVQLDVPSGKMVVANDLRPLFDVSRDYNINTDMGCMMHTIAMADNKCASAFVGNTSPSFMELSKTHYQISSGSCDMDPPGIQRAYICTDLWWFCVVDLNEYLARGGNQNDRDITIVEVPIGIYEFTHYFHRKDFDRDDRPVVFTDIKHWYTPGEWIKANGSG